MAFLTQEQADLLAETGVRIATLVELRFRDETMYLWNGERTLDIAGHEWQGFNGWAGIDGLPDLHGTQSNLVTVSISGVDPDNLALAKQSVDQVQGRFAFFWTQLFDAKWQPAGPRIPAWRGVMQRIVITRTEGGDLAGGTRSVGLEIENPFAARGLSAAGRYTDGDQNYRHPGDRFCRFVSDQQAKTIIWPDY